MKDDFEKIFKEYELYVVSLTEPYEHNHTLNGIECKMPAGGLTAALDPLLRTHGGTWIASGTGDADWDYVDENNRLEVPPEDPSYTLRRVKFSKSEYLNYYYGFNHQTFWPLLHEVFHRPDFNPEFWEGYKKANRNFAEAVSEEMDKNEKPLIWFQDFQLALAPKMLMEKTEGRNSDLKTKHFWHVPWPTPERFFRCPWSEEIIEGLLANDIIGFHVKSYAENFLKSVEKLDGFKVNLDDMTIKQRGNKNKTFINYSPISVDYESIEKSARTDETEEEMNQLMNYSYLSDCIIGLGIDRLDYAKGIPERLEAVDRFLEKYPCYQEKFVFIQAGAPLLSRVPDYRRLSQKVEVIVDEINMKYEKGDWKPILFIKEKLDSHVMRALQRMAHIYIVSSLHDGMNIVAKENIAADIEKDGVLLLSKFTGAAEELIDSILINPYDQEGLAENIKKAIELPLKERRERMKRLRETVKNHTIHHWLCDLLSETKECLQI